MDATHHCDSSTQVAVIGAPASDSKDSGLLVGVVYPIWTGLAVAAIGWLVARWRQRQALRTALATEMKAVVALAEDVRAYLANEQFPWQTPGNKVTGAPIDTGPTTFLFDALLPDLNKLPKPEIEAAVAFYRHNQLCANLTRSLYDRLWRFVDKNPLTEDDVRQFETRRLRIVAGFTSLIAPWAGGKNCTLKDLPTHYAIPSTKDAADAMRLKPLSER